MEPYPTERSEIHDDPPRRARRSDPEDPHVVIVGGGASGTLAAIHLLRRRAGLASLTLIERIPAQLARGVAYGRCAPHLPLNVRAASMSVDATDPAHFVRWCRDRRVEVPAEAASLEDAYLPRRIYGDYLADTLQRAIAAAAVDVAIVSGSVTALVDLGPRLRLDFADHASIEADRVVLALGNFAPAERGGRQAWDRDALDGLAEDASLLFVGAGLSTIDHLLSLERAGHRGPIVVVSRHGRFPATHAEVHSPKAELAVPDGDAGSPRALLRRARAALAAEPERPWQAIVDGFRILVPGLWGGWSDRERRAFLRHLRHPWEVHRHRLPPASAELVARLRRERRLELVAGRVRDVRRDGEHSVVSVALRSGAQVELRADVVVDCSGPAGDYRAIDDPLVRALLEAGTIVPDAFGLGLVTDAEGRIVRRDGSLDPRLVTLGPPRRGMLWESTAIGEIREQARALAGLLTGSDAHPR